MSLVSCITAQMQYTMMDSDSEDKSAEITAKLKGIQEQGLDIGKMLSNIDTQLDDIKYSYRELQGYEGQAMYSNDPKVRSAVGEVKSRMGYYNNLYNGLQQRKLQLEYEKKRIASQEKELTAQQIYWNQMKKFAQGAMEKFKGFVDGAIKRFFG